MTKKLIILALTIIILAVVFKCHEYRAEASTVTKASWYSVNSCKKEGTWQKYQGRCADGSVFKNENKTAASWDYPFGSKLKVTSIKTGKSVIVEITDRGPSKKLYKKGRKLDLSKSAFNQIADLREGVIQVLIEEI